VKRQEIYGRGAEWKEKRWKEERGKRIPIYSVLTTIPPPSLTQDESFLLLPVI
jgi:hypothetical protein